MTQRPIKFRAWSDLDQKFAHTAPDIKPHIDQEFCTFEVDSRNDSQPLTLQQFTGLTDKNGKEIYEGDFVCIESIEGAEFGRNWIVQYSTLGDAAFDVYDQINCIRRLEGEDGGIGAYFTRGGIDDVVQCCVAGNRFENPELFESD